MKIVNDAEKLLGNIKFVIVLIISFLVMGINLSAAEKDYTGKKYFQNQEKNKNDRNEKDAVKEKKNFKKDITENFNSLGKHYKNLYEEHSLTDEEWDNIKNTILSRTDEMRRKSRLLSVN